MSSIVHIKQKSEYTMIPCKFCGALVDETYTKAELCHLCVCRTEICNDCGERKVIEYKEDWLCRKCYQKRYWREHYSQGKKKGVS